MVEELSQLDQDLRKIERRSSQSALAKARDLRHEIRKRENSAGAGLADLKHTLSVMRQGEIEAKRLILPWPRGGGPLYGAGHQHLRRIRQLHPQVYAALMAERTRQLAEQHQDRTVSKSIFESFCHAFIIHSPDDNSLVELAGQKGMVLASQCARLSK